MKCLGLDIGSTTIKGAVLDLERNEVGCPVAQPFPAPITGLPPGRVEIAPADVETQVRLVLEQLLESAPDADRLYCSGQMGGVILVDETGAALKVCQALARIGCVRGNVTGTAGPGQEFA